MQLYDNIIEMSSLTISPKTIIKIFNIQENIGIIYIKYQIMHKTRKNAIGVFNLFSLKFDYAKNAIYGYQAFGIIFLT